MYSKILSGAALGIDGLLISVESDISRGLPGLSLVGYLSSSVKEAGERVRTALKNVGYSLPSRRITVNLSPADVHKEGAGFDLAISISILISMGEIPINSKLNRDLEKTVFLGEMGLDGSVLPVTGVLPILDHAVRNGIRRAIVPCGNFVEASYIKKMDIIPVDNLYDLVEMMKNRVWDKGIIEIPSGDQTDIMGNVDLADIKGQEVMKRGVVVAVAGFHNILLTGAAGSGKSMISKCMPDIMPPLTFEESLELTKIYSVAGKLDLSKGLMKRRPFRSPHQNVSEIAMIGGGANPKPGEVSLASGGVLFLDEFPEFSRGVIESLRQPMEDRCVTVSRLRNSFTFPSRFMLVSARNNCPCGFFPDRNKCRCSMSEIYRYQNKISHPIMDRIDMRIEVRPLTYDEMFSTKKGMSSEDARAVIKVARRRQEIRYKNESFSFNSELPQGYIDRYLSLGEDENLLLRKLFESNDFSARGYYKLLKLARTIADISDRENIECCDLEEAAFYRNESGGTNWE
ncbi:MAG: YifB family Mg chelatase-like AAA ATPase [Eubacterium sp.]|nr:YifB family Mg chelatase-like AAA ATPase [Eubacterium sp.]